MKDQTAVYDQDVLPLLEQLRDACAKHGFPMVTMIGVQSEDNPDDDSQTVTVTEGAAWIPHENGEPQLAEVPPHLLVAFTMLRGDFVASARMLDMLAENIVSSKLVTKKAE